MLKVLFEDNHVLVVVKPVNTPTQEDESGDPDMLTLCKQYLKEKHNKPGNVFCGLVHRLDRPVGGIMVFAKTSKAASRLSEQIREHKMEKHYIIKVEGRMEQQKGTLRHFLKKNNTKNVTEVRDRTFSGYKEAILKYSVMKGIDGYTFLGVELVTGRSHQIRAQFAYIGYPLVGDKKYGSTRDFKALGIALYASYLSFKHPTQDKIHTFQRKPEWLNKW